MYRNILFMLASAVAAVTALFFLGVLSHGWAYGESTFGGHLGFVLPILLGILMFLAGAVYADAAAAAACVDAGERYSDLQEAYEAGRIDARTERIARPSRGSTAAAGTCSLADILEQRVTKPVEHQSV
jgi:uncharacterized membrane protein